MLLNHKKLNHKKQSGFTLLELLVVIGIIAVLATISLSSYSTAQKKTRDAQRKADLKQIQNALEQYYSICGYKYPTPVNNTFSQIKCGSTTIMQTLPNDPQTGNSYTCSSCDENGYTICVNLETEASQYCISNLQ